MNTPMDTMVLNRRIFTDRSTIGELFIDGEKECFILEPSCRSQGPGFPVAIPAGKYEIVLYASPRFKKRVPLLLKVPGREMIEIHSGNKPEDTHGCLLPGNGHSVDWVSNSGVALEVLIAKIEKKLETGPFYIGITGGGSHGSIS